MSENVVCIRAYELWRVDGIPIEYRGRWSQSITVGEDDLIDAISEIVGGLVGVSIDFNSKTVYKNGKPILYFKYVDTAEVRDSKGKYVELYEASTMWTLSKRKVEEFVKTLNPKAKFIVIDWINGIVKVDDKVKYFIKPVE